MPAKPKTVRGLQGLIARFEKKHEALLFAGSGHPEDEGWITNEYRAARRELEAALGIPKEKQTWATS